MANIIWTKPNGWVEESGAHVVFKAPCNCANAGSLVIGSNTYSIVNAIGQTIAGVGGAFVSGAILDFILDCESKKAYLQNSAAADYVVEQGTSGSWSYRKWKSGKKECWATVAISLAITAAWGNIYESTNYVQPTFPSGFFTTAPKCFTSMSGVGAGCWIEFTGGVSTTGCQNAYLCRGATLSARTYTFAFYAIGT